MTLRLSRKVGDRAVGREDAAQRLNMEVLPVIKELVQRSNEHVLLAEIDAPGVTLETVRGRIVLVEVDTSAPSWSAGTVTLPSEHTLGDEILVVDIGGNATAEPITVTAGSPIFGSDEIGVSGTALSLVSDGEAWVVVSIPPLMRLPPPTADLQMLVSTGGQWTLVAPPASTLTDTLMYNGSGIEWAGRIYVQQEVTPSTVALWRMNTAVTGLVDSGPNGLDLAVFAGTARGASAWPTMGGVYFDGTVGLRAPASALLRLTGDMTIVFVTTGFRDGTLTGSCLFSHGTAGETEVTNVLYSLQYGTFPAFNYLHEHGAGVNASHDWGASVGQHVFASWGIPVMIHMVRASGVVNVYMQGILITPSSGTLTAPTGGGDGRLTIGCSSLGGGGTFAAGYNGVITDFLIENRAWSTDEVKVNFNRCLGQVMGRRP